MNNYYLILKSHSEAPDYEDDVKAYSKVEAVKYFYESLKNYGWELDTISKNTFGEDKFNGNICTVCKEIVCKGEYTHYE